MKNLTQSFKKRYSLFILTLLLIIVSALFILQRSINLQRQDAYIINKSGKQRMLSQHITKIAQSLDRGVIDSLKINSLQKATNEFEEAHSFLYTINKGEEDNKAIDSLLKISEVYLQKITTSSRAITRNPNSKVFKSNLETITGAESTFLLTMDTLVNEYQKKAEVKLQRLNQIIYFLAGIGALIIIGEFIFILLPILRQLFQRNKELEIANIELAKSEKRLKLHLLELQKLRINLEAKDKQNKIFIEQAPTSLAILDQNMCYIAVSQQWITDFKMEGREVIGRSHYELFPEIGEDWKIIHQKCLQGAIDVCDEALFKRADGTEQWIYWDIRPWYITDHEIGGVLMHTGDVTQLKEKDQKRIRIEKILEKTNEIARIGTWELDLTTNNLFWSKMVCEIHEVSEDQIPDLESSIHFYKEGKSRDTIQKVVDEAIKEGKSFDVEVQLVTNKGSVIWIRVIGQTEIVEGTCKRIFGVFQDVNTMKLSQLALNKAHTELKAIFNSGPIAIISVDNDGIINHFNNGAEQMLGYSASEMIGIKAPETYHIKEELDQFRIDIAAQYGKDPNGFDPYFELAKQNEHDTREWTYRRKDGSTFPVQLTLTAVKNEFNEKIGYLGVSFDITKSKKTENELLQKNKLLNFAEEITMIGHWKWDTVTDKVEWSNNLYNVFELDRQTINLNFNTYFYFVHPEDKAIVTQYFENATKGKGFKNFTHRIVTNGKTKTIQLLAEVFKNEKGEVVEMIGTCQDITEQRMAENKFRGLLESAPDAMVIVNENGIIQLINKQAEILFGYSASELIEKTVEILIPKRFTEGHQSYRNNFFAHPKARGMGVGKELFGINKQGEEIPIQISLSPLKTEEGLLVSAAIRDITEQKIAERKIIQAKESLEVLTKHLTGQNKQLADFAHITSHNLRSPVSNLNALLHLYTISESEEERKVLFEKFEIVIGHLTSTLNTLIEALKTKKGEVKELEILDFEEILSKTKEIISAQIIKSNSIITSNFSKSPKIKYHKTYLESIFLNLVTNAVKYRSPDRNLLLHIETEYVDGKIKLTFTDNGLGIDLKKHGHKLFGLNKTFHRHPEAKGVGLYLTKIQIESLGGTIYATSEVNKGSVFTVIFN